jgi:RNA polymerase sigma-70 factor (ECF subfamily)
VGIQKFPEYRTNPVHDELTALALAARDGDRIALAAFVRRAQPEVWRFCAARGDRETADDLTQETFVRALGSLASFRGESSARTWLLAIARHTAADAVRRAQRRRRRTRGHADLAGTVPNPADHHAVADLVAGLDADRRDAFVLTQVLGLSYAEAAEVCGCEVGTIRSRVARARHDLLDRLAAAAHQ